MTKRKKTARKNISNHFQVMYRPISSLKLDTGNPRKHSPKQIREIASSIEGFGFNVPVLVDSNLKVIAGHGRVLACKLLGWNEIPTLCLEHLTEPQARAFMLADNRLTEHSTWDEPLLAQQLKDLADLDLDFDLELTGFKMAEIDVRIESLGSEGDDVDAADSLPKVPLIDPVTRGGDLWLLGNHRVYCGSALEDHAYTTLMASEVATVVFTDPPWNVPIDGNVSGLGSIHHREFTMASGEMTGTEFIGFLTSACSLLARNTSEGSIHFICIDWRHLGELLVSGRAAYTELKNLCVWCKDNAGMGSFYRSQHELICVFKNGRAAHRNNVKLGEHGRNRTNVWQYPGAATLRKSEDGKLITLHPTVKPVSMIADAIMDCSGRGDIVLDSFLGSGSTVIAAERTGRRCYGIEIDPLYVDLVIRRWQEWTRGSALNAASGRSFETVALERQEKPLKTFTARSRPSRLPMKPLR